MNERRIEALSLLMTAGVGLGSVVTGHAALHIHFWALGCCIAGALLLTALLGGGEKWLCYPLFAVLGMLCYFTASMPPVRGGGWPRLLQAADTVRRAIDALPFRQEGTAPLLKAFLTGDRSGLGRETVAVFRRSGASHLLALSGLHIGIIYTLFSRATLLLGNTPPARIGRFVLTVPAALAFTLMTGAGPSIVRAFLFITLSELTRLLGRRRDPLKVFSAALLLQLTVHPLVITSVGFQLSYCAMLGIFLFFPALQRWYPSGGRFNPVRKIWEAAALSISCQITTAQIAWFYFHTFPRYFLITNVLAIPVTTAVISLGIASLVLSALGLCPHWVLALTDGSAALLLRILEIIAAM